MNIGGTQIRGTLFCIFQMLPSVSKITPGYVINCQSFFKKLSQNAGLEHKNKKNTIELITFV